MGKSEEYRSKKTGRFQKRHRPWNDGTKGLTGANSKSFKKGNVPANRKPLWTERECSKDGFILMKVPEPNPYTGAQTRYKHKHVYVWEQEHGPVPKGMVVAFIDGDKSNCELENLMLISRAVLLVLNQHGYKDMPKELKPTVLALAKLQVKIGEIERLGDEDLRGEALAQEMARAKAVSSVATQIINNARLVLNANGHPGKPDQASAENARDGADLRKSAETPAP